MARAAFGTPWGRMRGTATQSMGCHRRGAGTTQTAPRRPNPSGAWGLRPHASFLVVNDASHIVSSSRLAWDSQAPRARPMRLLGQAPRNPRSEVDLDSGLE